MAKVHRIETREALEQAAGSWIARLEADDVSGGDRRRFAEWLAEDDRHRETFEAMRHTWHRLDALGVVAAEVETGQPKPARATKRRVVWAAAATVILAVAAAWWQSRAPEVLYYQTAVGHQVTATLDDGSAIQLNTDTHIEVEYSSQERTVRLQRGEAHFTVAPETTRPFVVLAGDGLVRAVGTQFNVYLTEGGQTEVTVTEGIVDVASRQDDSTAKRGVPATRPARVSEGQRVRYDGEIREVAQISLRDLERRLAWRQGMLSFDGETLQEVVDQVSRYTDVDFVIADAELRNLEVGGYFKSTDIEALTALLSTAFAVGARREGDRIYLMRREL